MPRLNYAKKYFKNVLEVAVCHTYNIICTKYIRAV